MPIRITGLNSGLDTEALVSELVSAYRKKTEKYTKAQTKLTWKQEAWQSLSSKTYSFRTSLDSMRLSTYYKLKTTSVSNSTKANVTAGNNAVNGSHSLNITSLAKAGYLTGAKLKRSDNKAVTKDTTLAALGYNGTDGKVSLNGKEIALSGDMTVNDAVNKLQSAGVTASFDEANQRIFISSTESGKDNDFTLSALSADGKEALKKLGLYTKSDSATAMYEQYEAVQNEYNQYVADESAVGNTPMDRTSWIKDKLEKYNQSSDTVTKANEAEAYLQKAAAYQDALKTMKTIEDDVDQSKISTSDAKKLLENGSRFVAGNTIYTLSGERDDDGRSYYTVDGSPNGTKYYLDTESVQAKDEQGNPVYNDDGSAVMETVAVFRTKSELDAGTGGFRVSTADEYLKEKDFTDETIAKYRGALSEKAGFETAIEAEKDASAKQLENRTAELEKEFLSKIEGTPTAAQEAQAKADAQTQAQKELEITGAYKEWRSLEAVQNMTAAEIEAAQATVKGDRETAQDFIDDNAFFASYARQYAAAEDAATQTALAEEINKDFEYLIDNGGGNDTDYSDGAVRIDGQDATIYLNGAEYTSSSNTFSINGLTITALATTTTKDKIGTAEADASAITITTATDNQGIYDKIKDFLSDYNSLINQMTSSYNAASVSDYEPLTDEEKESMTDSQIEKWEEKGKSGVLRRDSTLSALMSTLTTVMSKSYEINGKKYSLSSFGIKTLGILNAEKNEHNAYHIDGDQDDDAVKGNTDKLMAAIVEDPDAVAEFFQLLTNDISNELGKKMSSTSMRTYGTFYNDKEMAKEYSDYTTTISKWEQKLADIEESYYKKFAAMESALAMLQSQSSQLAGLLG